MSFKLGDKVQTKPIIGAVYPVETMQKIHDERIVMEVVHISGATLSCIPINGGQISWLYHREDLIPYKGMLNEVEEL